MGRTERNGQDASLRLAGRYRLVEKLGTGGMSVVWRGYDEILGRSVAVKVLSPRLAGDQTFRDRLRQEALAAARLCHPHITGVFDFGEAPLNDRLTVPYVVMELHDGESVAARIGRQGALPWSEAVTIAAEVASALATAHARGLVHRDVTPANVMLTGSGAKVVDFGISAIVGQRDAAPDGSLLGTPAYLAPERLGGSHVSAATDVYALGLLLYRALTGRLPWPAENTTEALRAHLYADPDPLPETPGLPPAVGELCLRCLAKDPVDRPDAAEVARILAATVGLQPIIPPLNARDNGTATFRGATAPVAPTRAGVPAGLSVGRWRSPVALVGAALAYLGLPGGAPGPRPPAGALRLRAGLRIGSALRVGGVHPLGGGVFSGGHLGRDVLTGRRPLSDRSLSTRHRTQAGLVTLALLGVAGLSWLTTRDSPEVEQAQAAGAGTVAVVPRGTTCAVRYQLKRDSGSAFEAELTVATTDEFAGDSWRIQFAYPGSQHLTDTPKAVTQHGRKVVGKGSGKLQMFTLRGDYRGTNPLPLSFTIDGHKCRAEVLGSLTADQVDAADPVSEAAGPEKKETAQGGSGSGSGSGSGEAKKAKPPKKKSRPESAKPSAPASPPPTPAQSSPLPSSRKGTGFSLA
ncbi:protein kinase domain-containing protein [Micromonosporaceae bacterium Da 78-11]